MGEAARIGLWPGDGSHGANRLKAQEARAEVVADAADCRLHLRRELGVVNWRHIWISAHIEELHVGPHVAHFEREKVDAVRVGGQRAEEACARWHIRGRLRAGPQSEKHAS